MTELIWDGKYDARGKRVAPTRLALPFQTVETVNEPAGTRQLMLDLFSQGRDPEWRNRLIWGDKKYVLPALLPEFAGKVDLIYIDPPFDTGADFSFTTQIPDSDASFTKEPSMIEQKAYRDTWGRGLDGYLQWFYETVVVLHELLSEKGSIYVHLDWHVGHYAKAVLDEVFGIDNFQNEIVWKRTTAHNDSKTWSHVTDVIFFYKQGGGQIAWNTPYSAHKEAYLSDKYTQVEADGRRYQLDNLTSPNPRPNMTYEWKGHKPPANGWRYSKETMAQLDEEGRIWYPDSKDKRPRLKRYLDESKGELLDNLWEDIPPVNSQAEDRTGYRTQKPIALLERIINASSNPGDLVLDCFCGSGTTAVAAETLGRRWITCDLGRFAIQTARKRLLAMPNVRPFMVQNLGKYERQAWQAAEFAPDDQRAAGLAAYRRFILDLYRATPIDGYAYLHGLRAGRFVYVGSVDAPVTAEDVKAVARECWKASGRVDDASNAADVLGWDFAFEVNETAKAIAADANIKLSFKRIPREVLEKKAVEQGDIRFFELAALSLDLTQHGDTVTLSLTDFMVPPDDVPLDVARAISHWSQWIDYWAVDWDFRDDTFHNQWQSYRTRKDPTLQRQVAHAYDAPGRYCIVVKVIDILGNDTTKSMSVDVE